MRGQEAAEEMLWQEVVPCLMYRKQHCPPPLRDERASVYPGDNAESPLLVRSVHNSCEGRVPEGASMSPDIVRTAMPGR